MTTIGVLFMLISGLLYSILLYVYLKRRPMWSNVESLQGQDASGYTINGLGFTHFGNFRKIDNTYVSYTFFAILGCPLFPVQCIRRGDSEKDYANSWGTTTIGSLSYKYYVYGTEKWSLLELLQIYIFQWSLVPLIVFAFSCVCVGILTIGRSLF